MRYRVRFTLLVDPLNRVLHGDRECRKLDGAAIDVRLDEKSDALVIDGVKVPCIYSHEYAHKPTARGILTPYGAASLFGELQDDMKDPRRFWSSHLFLVLTTARDMVRSYSERCKSNG